MEKYYLKNGSEVQLGDTLTKSSKFKHPLFGKGVVVESVVVTKDSVPTLIKEGIITTHKDGCQCPACKGVSPEVPMDMEYYVQKIADKMGWKIDKTFNYLNTIDTIYPTAAFSMVLREIAIELDKKYKDHIQNSPEIYVISLLNGRITKANKAHIKNYRNFAAFRTVSDAKIACSIVKDILKEMFKNNG